MEPTTGHEMNYRERFCVAEDLEHKWHSPQMREHEIPQNSRAESSDEPLLLLGLLTGCRVASSGQEALTRLRSSATLDRGFSLAAGCKRSKPLDLMGDGAVSDLGFEH